MLKLFPSQSILAARTEFAHFVAFSHAQWLTFVTLSVVADAV
jgi:hypothetical protein